MFSGKQSQVYHCVFSGKQSGRPGPPVCLLVSKARSVSMHSGKQIQSVSVHSGKQSQVCQCAQW